MSTRIVTAVLLLSTLPFGNASFAQDDELAILSGAEVSATLESQRTLDWLPGQIIVKFKTVTTNTADARLHSMGFTDHLQDTSGGGYVYSLPSGRIKAMTTGQMADQTQAAVKRMSNDPGVEYAQLNYIVRITRTPDDPGFAQQWHYRNNGSGNGEAPGGINLPRAWDRTIGSSAAVIAVIDTGILPDHPDIEGSPNLVPGFDMISDPFGGNDGDGRDDDATDPGDGVAAGECGPGSRAEPDSWHGTHVAGTVGVGRTDNASGVAGTNWSSRVVPLRALGRCGGSTVDINDAIRWAAGLPVPGIGTNPNPANVINMSLGAGAPCSASPATQSAINDAVAAGTTVVVAAGNEARDAENTFPASCDNVISVAAGDFNGELVTRYSNFGDSVDILAPGGDTSADEDGDGNPDGVLSLVQGGFAFFNGTSMAAPHAAGVAGLLLAQDPTLTPREVERLLKTNALPRNDDECPRPCGAGLLNADIAISAPVEPAPIRMTVSPATLELDEGDTDTLVVTLMRSGAPVGGETVRFSSGNTDVATISPATAVSDAAGQARATVTAITEGNTNFSMSIPGQTQTMPVDVNIRVVPGIGVMAALLLAMLIGTFGFRRLDANAAVRAR